MTSMLLTLQRLVLTAAGLAIAFPVITLLCLAYVPSLLYDLHSSFSPPRPTTMLAVFFCGLSLWWQADETTVTTAKRRAAQGAAILACLLAVLPLLEHLLSIDLGMNRWLISNPDLSIDPHPGRMAPATAFAILLLGLALLWLDTNKIAGQARHSFDQYAALVGGTIGGIALVGYLYGVRTLYKVGSFSAISIYAAFLLFALSLGILCARPTRGLMATLTSEKLGGLMLRRLLPFAVTLPILAGWIRITAQRSGHYDFTFGVALAVASVMLIMLAFIWTLAGSLNHTDGQKKHIMQILQQREARHRLALRAGRMGTFHHDLDTHTLAFSPELEAIFGLPPMSFRSTFDAFQDLIHPDDRQRVRHTVDDAVQNRTAYDLECRILRDTPEDEAWIAVTGQVLPDSTGRPRQITGVMFDISERKRSETALRQSEEQLRVITDALPGLIAYVDRNERYRFVNAGYERHFGLPRERIIGGSVEELLQQDYSQVQAFIRRVLEGEQITFETTSLRQAGEETLLSTYVPEWTAEGKVEGFYVLITDMTDRKRTEQALRESEERFRHLFEQASDGIVMADMAGHYLDVNTRACHMLGYSREELLSMSVTDLLDPHDYRRLRDIKTELLDGHRHSAEWQLRRKDGATLTVEISAKLQPDRRWHAIVRDITDRKRAEAGLRESEAHFRMLADATPVLVWMAGPDRGWTWLNRSWLQYTGRTLEDELGQGWTSGIHPDDRAYYFKVYTAHFSRHEPFEMEYRLRRQDGTYGWILDRGVPLLTENGSFRGYLGSAIDITDRKHAEEQLQKWTMELEARVQERTQALVRSQERLRALASDLSATEQQERRRLATELHDYLAQLLVVARMKLGQTKPLVQDPKTHQLLSEADNVLLQSLDYTRFLVAELSPQVLYQFGLPAALKWLADQMKTHALTVTVHCEVDQLHMAEDSAVILYQSVRELLFNVVKHARTNEASIVLACPEESRVAITVRDQGCGFNPTTMMESDRTTPGRFGLFNVQERVEALGGHLTLRSSEDSGTTITLTAPIAAPSQSEQGPTGTQSKRLAASSVVPSPCLRVLLVDDHEMVRQGLRSVLDSYQDLEVIGEAGDGEAAITLAAALRPDVVVMDVNMPKIDGIEATRRIVALQPDVIVIGLSVQNEHHIEEAMIDAGAAVFVTKERAAGQLYEAIVSTVRTRR
ncbi:MAG: PAS domain S-box protein [Nitrospira sp.]|nr:PAS domain S-box protein [Nitrospira sp.]